MDEIIIRHYKESEREQIIKLMLDFGLYLETLDDLQRVKYADGGEIYFTDKMLEEVKANNGDIFVAEVRGEIVGFIANIVEKLSPQDKKTVIQTKPGRVIELYVKDIYQKRGIGKRLIKAAEEALISKGCDVVKVGVFAPNKNAHNFYNNLGYIVREIDLIKKLNEYVWKIWIWLSTSKSHLRKMGN